MNSRIASTVFAFAVTAGLALPVGAMPLQRPSAGPGIVLGVNLPEPTDRALTIRRAVDTWAVRAIQGQGWGVPIIGSVRILSARFEPW